MDLYVVLDALHHYLLVEVFLSLPQWLIWVMFELNTLSDAV